MRTRTRTRIKKAKILLGKENDLSINSNYIDITANISNGKRFRCFLSNGFIIGTSGICKEYNE